MEHVHSRQKKGRPPHEARAQQWYLAKFGTTALWRVLRRLGGSEELRGELVRFVSRLFELKRRGVVDSVVEELLLVAPNAFHLVTWGRTLLADEAGRAAEARAAQWRPVPVAPAGPPAGAAEAPRLQASS